MMTVMVLTVFLQIAPCEDPIQASRMAMVDHHAGRLEQARSVFESLLACKNVETDRKIEYHLRLAVVEDRVSLHWNTRPSKKALEHLNAAMALAAEASPNGRMDLLLGRARYHYRSEMSSRNFTETMRLSKMAIEQAQASGAIQTEVDAVHLLGLVSFFEGNYNEARRLFDLSLAIEERAPEKRPFLLADYYRHTAFVDQREGEMEAAIQNLTRSFEIRKDNGLTDAAMFAAVSLVNALIRSARLQEAEAYLDYAWNIAEKINSPVGRLRVLLIRWDMARDVGQAEAAETYRRKALTMARGLKSPRTIERLTQKH